MNNFLLQRGREKHESNDTETCEKFLFLINYFCHRAILLLFLFGGHYLWSCDVLHLSGDSDPLLCFAFYRDFLQYERIRTKVYTDISVRTLPTRSHEEGSLWEKVKMELQDNHNWRAIIGLMLQLGIGMVSLICATLFYLTPIILLLSPILYLLDVSSITLFGIENKTFNISLFFMLLGAVSLWIGAYLGNSLVKMIGRYTRRLVKDFARR